MSFTNESIIMYKSNEFNWKKIYTHRLEIYTCYDPFHYWINLRVHWDFLIIKEYFQYYFEKYTPINNIYEKEYISLHWCAMNLTILGLVKNSSPVRIHDLATGSRTQCLRSHKQIHLTLHYSLNWNKICTEKEERSDIKFYILNTNDCIYSNNSWLTYIDWSVTIIDEGSYIKHGYFNCLSYWLPNLRGIILNLHFCFFFSKICIETYLLTYFFTPVSLNGA